MTYSAFERAKDVATLVQGLVSTDSDERADVAALPVDWIGMRILDGPAQGVVGQLDVWAWLLESVEKTRRDLLESVLAMASAIESRQVVAVFERVTRTGAAEQDDEVMSDIGDFLADHATVKPRLLDVDASRRAIDLARGITSTDAQERLRAARLAADVVASRALADEEAACFAGLLSYSVVVEVDPAVRHEQVQALAVAAHHGRLSTAHREIALAARLTGDEKDVLGTAT